MRTGGGTKFEPWPWQLEVAAVLPQVRRIQFLKARQLGMSWLVGAYALHTAMFHPGADVLLFSQTEDDAVELLSKIGFIYDHLPEFLQPPVGVRNTQVLEFRDHYSQLRALPSTRRAGRGFTGRLVVADEHAHHQWATENMAAADPAIEAGGQFISLSSAAGIGNLFADLWEKATQTRPEIAPLARPDGLFEFGAALPGAAAAVPESAWLPVFLPYGVRPGRGGDWWERKRETTVPRWLIFQEYPRDAAEAFVQTGRPRFERSYLDQHKRLCEEPLPPTAWPAAFAGWGEELRVFALPTPGHRYAAGADVAEGLEHGDYSDLVVFDADAAGRPVEVLSLHGHWEPDEFARRIDAVARLYRGVYGVERNNHGLTTLVTLRNLGTPGVHRERAVLNKQGQVVAPGRPGWLTTSVTKPLLIDELEVALRTFGIALRDALALPEFIFYQTNPDGSTAAPAGRMDDRVMSRGIAVQMLKHLPAGMDESIPDDAGPGLLFGGKTGF